MSGDYTRFTFDRRKRYSGVLMQQGRVQLDSDWNEAIDIVKERVRTLALDAFGPVGLPMLTTPDAFRIDFDAGPPVDLTIEPGRLYVGGWLAELFADEVATYLDQPFLPDPPPLPAAGDAVVYLDVWEREVTYVEDPELLDVALGGADTATRTQTVWQVKVAEQPGAECGVDVGEPPSAGRLSSEALAPPAPDDPCILPPQAGYRGLENRLYRVEIHEGGPLGTARFKWSRDNGSIVSGVSAIAVAGGQTTLTVDRIGRDAVLRFRQDDWVTVTDDHRELHEEPGEMARVIDIDEAQSQIVLDRALPTAGGRAFGANAAEIAERHTRVQRWDQNATTNTIDADGLIDTAAGPIDLDDDGVRVRFSTDPGGGEFRNGDYWVFAARTADASVEELVDEPPRGIRHRYVQLAAVLGLGTDDPEVLDCRPQPEGEREGCCCCVVTVGARDDQRADFFDLAAAVAAVPRFRTDAAIPVVICLLPGRHELRTTVVIDQPWVTIRGCGRLSPVIAPEQGPAFHGLREHLVLEELYVRSRSSAPAILLEGVALTRIQDNELENPLGLALEAQGARDLRVLRNQVQVGPTGGFRLEGMGMLVEGNRLVGATAPAGVATGDRGVIDLWPGSGGARIVGNEIERCPGHGITLGISPPGWQGSQLVEDVLIARNRLSRLAGSGITGDAASDSRRIPVILDDVRIEDNEIVRCLISPPGLADAEATRGGVVLRHVWHLRITGNKIEENGRAGRDAAGNSLRLPTAGIYVEDCNGLVVARNSVMDNGLEPDGVRIPGRQGGILGFDLAVLVDGVPGTLDESELLPQPDGWPAAAVTDNVVVAPRGQALRLEGIGPMKIRGNSLTARDIVPTLDDVLGSEDVDPMNAFFAAVLVLDFGAPAYLARCLAAWGLNFDNDELELDTPTEGDPWSVGGKVDFSHNQVFYDAVREEVEIIPAAVGLLSLDDLMISNNQTECTHGVDFQLVDTLAVGLNIRALGNGFTESLFLQALGTRLPAFSFWGFALLSCMARDNHATHCIECNSLLCGVEALSNFVGQMNQLGFFKKDSSGNVMFLCRDDNTRPLCGD